MIKPEDTLEWYKFGFNIVPINPEKKSTARKWQPWLDALNKKSITTHWQKHPDHELGAIVDDRLFILDADSEQAKNALYSIEKALDVTPNLIVKTSKGEHHYFRRAAGTYAHMASYSTKHEPEKIDIRTGRSRTEGRSIIVLPPSTNKTIKLNEAESVNDLTEVDQIFIDAIFKHNGQEAPRPKPKRERNPDGCITSTSEASEILKYITPNLSYNNWLKVLMGLHDKFQGSDEGLYLADEWSSQGEDYPGFEEIEYKWRSFTANKAGGVTFASVAKMAEAAGADLKEIARQYGNGGNDDKAQGETFQQVDGKDGTDDPEDFSNRSTSEPQFDIDYPPGIAGEIARYFFQSSIMPVKSFAIAGALTALSHLNGNKYYIRKSNTALNLYQCLIGDTGCGKEDPRNAIKRIFGELGYIDGLYEDMASGTGLLRALQDNPSALIMRDELGLYLQNVLSDKGSIHQKDFVNVLISAFGWGRSFSSKKVYADRKNNIPPIQKPYVSLIGTTTAIELMNGITPNTIDNGFLNRILFIPASEKNPKNREPDFQISEDLKQKLDEISDIFDGPTDIGLEYEDDAHDLLVRLVEERDITGEFVNLWQRYEELIIRVSGLLALGDGEIIKHYHVRWAHSYVTNLIEAFARRLGKDLSENLFQKQCNKALDLITNATRYSNDTKFRKFCKKGYMPKGKLTKLMKIKPKDMNDIILYLQETKQISKCDQGGTTLFSVL